MIGTLAIAALLAGGLSSAVVITTGDEQASRTQEQERPAVVETTESKQANPFLD